MNRSIILLAVAAFLCAGCDKLPKSAAARKKLAADQEVASQAQAKLAARIAAGGMDQAAGNPGNAGAALVGMLCSSAKLMENVESDLDLLEAFSGEGGDRDELKRQVLEFRNRYRPIMEKGLSARGATFGEFSSYALGQAAAEQKQKFKALVAGKCPRGDKDLVEKTAGGLMYYFTAAAPK